MQISQLLVDTKCGFTAGICSYKWFGMTNLKNMIKKRLEKTAGYALILLFESRKRNNHTEFLRTENGKDGNMNFSTESTIGKTKAQENKGKHESIKVSSS
ncbi:hypothetical protein RCL_jg2420.t1 [Rhizophagus clarus]|uniref:Uncharacterized protein n=1 Tax=Rhizophagus clarus TaxID=94130 RepID=A0A8H3LSE5_9GLOM|nr:hypothetical protein RCL_jg2420.t1 [Rhizophagus clarus]